MWCNICGKKVILTPSASERAAKYGGKASDYTSLFTVHADCAIAKYKADTITLIAKRNA